MKDLPEKMTKAEEVFLIVRELFASHCGIFRWKTYAQALNAVSPLDGECLPFQSRHRDIHFVDHMMIGKLLRAQLKAGTIHHGVCRDMYLFGENEASTDFDTIMPKRPFYLNAGDWPEGSLRNARRMRGG